MIRRCNVGAWRAQQRMATNTRKRSGLLTMSCPDPRTSVDVSHRGTDTRSHANAVKSRERLRKERRRGRARLDAQKPRAVRSTRCAPLVGLARVATRPSAACRAYTRWARGKKCALQVRKRALQVMAGMYARAQGGRLRHTTQPAQWAISCRTRGRPSACGEVRLRSGTHCGHRRADAGTTRCGKMKGPVSVTVRLGRATYLEEFCNKRRHARGQSWAKRTSLQ